MAMNTLDTITVTKIPKGGQDFCVNFANSNVSTTSVPYPTPLKAAPGAGYSIYLTSIIMVSNVDGLVFVLNDSSGNKLFSSLLSSTSGVCIKSPKGYAIKVNSNNGVYVSANKTGDVFVHLIGKIVKD